MRPSNLLFFATGVALAATLLLGSPFAGGIAAWMLLGGIIFRKAEG